MARIYTCDRCDRHSGEDTFIKTVSLRVIYGGEKIKANGYWITENVDLCMSCSADLRDALAYAEQKFYDGMKGNR